MNVRKSNIWFVIGQFVHERHNLLPEFVKHIGSLTLEGKNQGQSTSWAAEIKKFRRDPQTWKLSSPWYMLPVHIF